MLTVVDRFTRWPEAIPIPDATAETCTKALPNNWVARYGVPGVITCNKGSQFTSRFWSDMKKLLGIKPGNNTTAYNPKANWMVKWMHRPLKDALRARLPDSPNWMNELPFILIGMCSAWMQIARP